MVADGASPPARGGRCGRPDWREFLESANLTALAAVPEGNALVHRQMLDEQALDALLSSGSLVTLTDRYAPVDQMLAPVFRGLTRQ